MYYDPNALNKALCSLGVMGDEGRQKFRNPGTLLECWLSNVLKEPCLALVHHLSSQKLSEKISLEELINVMDPSHLYEFHRIPCAGDIY